MPSNYAWIIDKDHMARRDAKPGTNSNAVGVLGPRDAPDDLEAKLQGGEGEPFRMYDDDGNLYYEGRIVRTGEESDDLNASEEGFEPLDDFGTPNAGCTEIRYRRGEAWVRL